jgi:hypothetical protein
MSLGKTLEEKTCFHTTRYRWVWDAIFSKGRYSWHGDTSICLSNSKQRQSVTVLFDVSDIFKLRQPSTYGYMIFSLLLELMAQSPLAKAKVHTIACYEKQMECILYHAYTCIYEPQHGTDCLCYWGFLASIMWSVYASSVLPYVSGLWIGFV